MPSAKRVTCFLLVHPNAPDLAWGKRGWTKFSAATVFSEAGSFMFAARNDVRGRWLLYPDVLHNPPELIPVGISTEGAYSMRAAKAKRAAAALARKARADALRRADPLPTGVKHKQAE